MVRSIADGGAPSPGHNEPWRRELRAALYKLARTGKPFTMPQVVREAGLVDDGNMMRNALPSLAVSARKAGLIEKTGKEVLDRRTPSAEDWVDGTSSIVRTVTEWIGTAAIREVK